MNEDKIIVQLVLHWIETSKDAIEPRLRHSNFVGTLEHTLEAGLRNTEVWHRLKANYPVK